MSADDLKDELNEVLDKLRRGELTDTPFMVWYFLEDEDEARIYLQGVSKGDALAIIATILHTFNLNPWAALAGTFYHKEVERRDSQLYRGRN